MQHFIVFFHKNLQKENQMLFLKKLYFIFILQVLKLGTNLPVEKKDGYTFYYRMLMFVEYYTIKQIISNLLTGRIDLNIIAQTFSHSAEKIKLFFRKNQNLAFIISSFFLINFVIYYFQCYQEQEKCMSLMMPKK